MKVIRTRGRAARAADHATSSTSPVSTSSASTSIRHGRPRRDRSRERCRHAARARDLGVELSSSEATTPRPRGPIPTVCFRRSRTSSRTRCGARRAEGPSRSPRPPGELTVKDTGPGIAPDEVPHAFDRFFLYRRYDGDRPVGTGSWARRSCASSHTRWAATCASRASPSGNRVHDRLPPAEARARRFTRVYAALTSRLRAADRCAHTRLG